MRTIIPLEKCVTAKTFTLLESLFSLPLAVVYRIVFMTEIWRLSMVPRVDEKKKWKNTSLINNETIEMQLQMVPIAAFSEEVQQSMMETYRYLTPEDSYLFVESWASTLHAVAQETMVSLEATNDSTVQLKSVTTEHCQIIDAKDGSLKENMTNRVFAAQSLPNIAHITTSVRCSDPEFIHLFLLSPRHVDLATTEHQSEIRALIRFLPVRAKENACFNVVSNVMFHTPTMLEDCTEEERQLHLSSTPAPNLQESHQPQRSLLFTMELHWPIYEYRFLWFAATRVLFMRLHFLRSLFQTGKKTFVVSTSMVSPTGSPIFEVKFSAGDLALPWEQEMGAKRETMFSTTDGRPIAFQKREISPGYSDLCYYNLVNAILLDTQYGKTISRCTLFDRYDQEDVFVRLEMIEAKPLKTPADANALYVEGIETAMEKIDQFYKAYSPTF
jgi:hypothetical protein